MRILIAEDDTIIADGLSRSLRQGGYAVDWAPNGVEADTALVTVYYDLLILDLGLPKMSGLEVLKRLRARNSQLPVLILTALDGTGDRVKGLDLGADDYMVKPFELAELEARMRALIRRAAGHDKPALTCGSLCYDSTGRTFALGSQPLSLTPREHAVLEHLMLRSGKPASKEALSEKIFGIDQTASADAIEIYIHRLRKKLDGADVAIVTLRGLGYLLEARQAHAKVA